MHGARAESNCCLITCHNTPVSSNEAPDVKIISFYRKIISSIDTNNYLIIKRKTLTPGSCSLTVVYSGKKIPKSKAFATLKHSIDHLFNKAKKYTEAT